MRPFGNGDDIGSPNHVGRVLGRRVGPFCGPYDTRPHGMEAIISPALASLAWSYSRSILLGRALAGFAC
jgi:hypothetical protein